MPRHVLRLGGPPALQLDAEVHLQALAGQLQSGTPPTQGCLHLQSEA